ncbi:MAG: sodium/solute symporter [Chitinophagales bacterium]|nr:sodium/solute symporter [Chitinophagales bacterium]
MQKLQSADYIVFLFYFIVVAAYGLFIYYRKKKNTTDSKDYFLAEGSLTWWAIGASLIASNISAEQFIGMSGAGFKMGLAIASYEWMAAATLIIVAVFFMPVYLKNKIYTMPQFLEQRYSTSVAMIMAVFWLLLYVLVNLTSILYLGALAVSSISGFNFNLCMYALAFFAILITLGGMKVIGYTDIIQVLFLVLGGLATTYLALNLVAEKTGTSGVLGCFSYMLRAAPQHFEMLLPRSNPSYIDLPGLTVLLGGMWIANLNYWGCNQYITQRALGADLPTARNGILFAAFLKLLMPVIVVIPGIAAFVLYAQDSNFATAMNSGGEVNPDSAYPLLLNLLPVGLKGLAFAALTAAVVASLAGKTNSIATIFSLDIFKKRINVSASESTIITVGKITVVASMLIAVLVAPFLGIDKKGGFQYIQEYTGFVSPGVFAVFLLGLFWKRATANAAMFSIVGGFILSIVFKFLPQWLNLSFLEPIGFSVQTASGLYEIPFLDRMAIVFVCCILGMVAISLVEKQSSPSSKIESAQEMYRVHPAFAVGSILIAGVLAALYLIF